MIFKLYHIGRVPLPMRGWVFQGLNMGIFQKRHWLTHHSLPRVHMASLGEKKWATYILLWYA